MKPKISIILPCYNGAKMLGGSIESVIGQTFKDWELIIVNDYSTDNTLEVAQLYAEKDKRIRVFSNEKNSKLPATLNHGFREARGEYWTWTSDDNLMLPNMLEVLSGYLDEHPDVGMIVADSENIDIHGNVLSLDAMRDNVQELLPLNNYVGAAFMYRKSVADEIGEYDEGLFLTEDYEYWLRMSFYTKITHISQVLYQYRRHANSLTATRQKQIAERLTMVRLMYLDRVEKLLQKTNPYILARFYARIVDELSGEAKKRYYFRFARKMPLRFGVWYLLYHRPMKWYRRSR